MDRDIGDVVLPPITAAARIDDGEEGLVVRDVGQFEADVIHRGLAGRAVRADAVQRVSPSEVTAGLPADAQLVALDGIDGRGYCVDDRQVDARCLGVAHVG